VRLAGVDAEDNGGVSRNRKGHAAMSSRRLRRRAPVWLAVVIAALVAAAPAVAAPRDAQLLVKFKPGAARADADRALAGAGARRAGAVRGLGIAVVAAADAARALTALRRNPLVAFAEPNAVVTPQELLPSDPSFPVQYSLSGGAWGWVKTRTTQAWDVTQGASSVVVAVLDTGLKPLADFSGQVVPGWNVLAGTNDTASNAGSHGTYVAGVVGLAAGNALGNAGYCPGCRIMPVQVGTDSGAYLGDLASGITWATDHGARVVNLSWAGAMPAATIDAAVAYARAHDVVVVAAAGNSNCDCSNYPAAAPGVLGVAGTDSLDAKASDSNFGSWVTIAAPESNMTAWPSLNGAPGYAQVGGTSLASPVVAAIAGLLFSAAPGATGAQVESALTSSTVPVAFAVRSGRVDALAALQALGVATPLANEAPVNTAAPEIRAAVNGGYDTAALAGAPAVGQTLVRGQGSWRGSAPLSLAAVQWQRCDWTGGSCVTAAATAKYTVQSTDAGFTFRLSVTVRNGLGSTTVVTAASPPVGTSATVAPPASTSPPSIAGSALVGQTLTASTGSWSGAPTSYAYQWLRCGASCTAIAGASSSGYAVQAADAGSTLRVAVTASNTAGSASATSAATGTVAAAAAAAPASTTPPVISGTPQVGQTLAASTGSWTGYPTSYAYQWLRCGASCTAIAGATASSYGLTSADASSTIEVAVTATNASGSTTATSSSTATVAPAPSSNRTVTFTGSLTPSRSSQSFTFATGAGAATAQLSFAKCSSLTLTVGGAAASGPSVLGLSATLAAGSSTATVSGGKCAFTLTVTTVSP
jgi:Subtilase family/Fervidolysin N-terminal prodomain